MGSGDPHAVREGKDVFACGPQKLRATNILGHVTLYCFDQTSGSCPIRAFRDSSKQVPWMDKESGVLGSV